MPQSVTPRLAAQLQRITENSTYTDVAHYIAIANLSTLSDGKRISTTTSEIISCSYADKPNIARWNGYANVEEMTAEFRCSGFLPEVGGLFCLIQRFGQDVDERMFMVLAVQDRGAFGSLCAVKAIPN